MSKRVKSEKDENKKPPEQTGAQGDIRLIREVMNPALQLQSKA